MKFRLKPITKPYPFVMASDVGFKLELLDSKD